MAWTPARVTGNAGAMTVVRSRDLINGGHWLGVLLILGLVIGLIGALGRIGIGTAPTGAGPIPRRIDARVKVTH